MASSCLCGIAWNKRVSTASSLTSVLLTSTPIVAKTPDDIQEEYDFTADPYGLGVPLSGRRNQVTIRIDKAIIKWFCQQVEQQGGGNY